MSRGIFVRHESMRDQRAVTNLVAAAELMGNPTTERRAAALLHAAYALMLIADGDRDEKARELAETTMRNLMAERSRG